MEMCGFSPVKADVLRKAVGKKDSEKLKSLRDDFISGGVASGEDERKLSRFWEELMEFARYAFNAKNLLAVCTVMCRMNSGSLFVRGL
jgi:DNA polymerase-3 subunit alpha